VASTCRVRAREKVAEEEEEEGEEEGDGGAAKGGPLAGQGVPLTVAP